MSAQHTPGPWMAQRNIHGWTIAGPSPRPDDHAREWMVARTASNEPEDAANAGLIAAAPELLAICKKLRHIVYERLQLDPVDENYCSICEQADIAIAKAEAPLMERAS